MARTAVTPAQGTRNGGVAPTATTIDATLVGNGVTIAAAKVGKLVIRFANTAGAACGAIAAWCLVQLLLPQRSAGRD